MDGIVLINKEKGISSFGVVSKIRKIFNIKKVGHCGTLDPDATGVLPIMIGNATKISKYLVEHDKEYVAILKIGVKTDSADGEGNIIAEDNFLLKRENEEEYKTLIGGMVGKHKQIPPMYSAIKVNGKKLYEYARAGQEVERAEREIEIYNISVENIDFENNEIKFRVACSKGTYIRSLCYDIGEKLNVFATMTELKRFKTSFFSEDDSINIDDLNKENIKEHLISIEEALKNYPEIYLTKGYDKLIINGVRVADKRFTKNIVENDILYKVYDENKKFLGLGRKNKEGFKMEKLLIG